MSCAVAVTVVVLVVAVVAVTVSLRRNFQKRENKGERATVVNRFYRSRNLFTRRATGRGVGIVADGIFTVFPSDRGVGLPGRRKDRGEKEVCAYDI